MVPSFHGSDLSEVSDVLDPADDEGWEDAEPDEEELRISCFFGDEIFSDVKSMMQHSQKRHDFDFLKVVEQLGGWVFSTPSIAETCY